MSHKFSDLILDVLEMMMVFILDFTYLPENALLLVDVSEAIEPFSLRGFLRFLLCQVFFGVSLKVLVLAMVPESVVLLGLLLLSLNLRRNKRLDVSCTKSSHRRSTLIEDLSQITLVLISSFEEHI